MSEKIKTRFAPSPTGALHVGGLRTALYNYLFAKHNKGEFILRIEDTDKSRFVEGATESLVKILNLTGLKYSEGVFINNSKKAVQRGDFEPYLQSERLDIYKKYIDELVKNNRAYFCFCSQERLEEMRKNQQAKKLAPKYDGKCRNLSEAEVEDLIKKKTPFVIRLKAPKSGFTEFKDLIYGKIKIANETIDDQVLIKSDGYPTYHFANVVDDHLMEISYVIRGEEWLPSTPKHILLYQAFGWDIPKFAHLPLLLNPDKSKLSKRQGDVAVEDYLNKGYLPEALLNFILLLGWNPKTEEEIFSLEEMIKRFDLSGVNKYGAIFNTEKLDWINGTYIRNMGLDELTKLCAPYLIKAGLVEEIPNPKLQIPNKSHNSQFTIHNSDKEAASIKYQVLSTGEEISFDYLKKVIALEQERMKKLSEIGELVKFIFVAKLEYDKDLLIWKKTSFEETRNNLELAYRELEKIDEQNFTKNNLEKVLRDLMERERIKTGELLWPLRVSLTGLKGSPGPFEVGEVLGKEKVLGRIGFAINRD
ncbi:MAG: glutamate--tRNA ligase [Patescibacteria group bacterium]|nr:glutamate--tRNA ligase [Patescibacteria group bacterium]